MLLKGREEEGPRRLVVLHLSLLIHVVLIVCSSGEMEGGQSRCLRQLYYPILLMFLIWRCAQAKRRMLGELPATAQPPQKPTHSTGGNGGTKKESPGNSTKVDHFSGLVVNALKKHLPLDRKAKLVFQESAQNMTIAWLLSCLEMKTGNNRNQHHNLRNTKITINQLITS